MILDATEIFDRQKIQPLGCLKKKEKKRGTTCKGRFLFVADIYLGIDDVADGGWATPERSV